MHGHATIGCRKIIRVLEVISKHSNLSVPHHTTVRQWVIRYGCYNLQTPLEHANDWISIGDLTISVGKLKCLAILGVRMSYLKLREDLTLSHKDVEILGSFPCSQDQVQKLRALGFPIFVFLTAFSLLFMIALQAPSQDR